jgi:alkylhydroperoxidase/carboxymuconolactone decarboxylase family protein YurZ
MSDTNALVARLAGVRAKRGYLLPHHGLMAITSPQLLEAYDATYNIRALDDRVLSHHDREFVWLAVLIATQETIATHHLAKFRAAGGSEEELHALLGLTSVTLGFEAFRFVDRNWRGHLPNIAPHAIYLDVLRRATDGATLRLVHLAAAAVHTCRAAWDALAVQIVAAYAAGVPELDLAEALSLAMFPGSVPHFVGAARVWRELIVAGEVDASPAFRSWAMLPEQGGYDEAAKSAR